MIVRSAPLFAALVLLATPALAQDSAEDAPPTADAEAPAEDAPPPADAQPPAEESPADAGAADEPAPLAPLPAMQPMVVASPFSPEQRNGWLTQCRGVFRQAGANLGGANGQLDACETQLLEFERSYVPPTGGGPPPVIMVRVPVVRPPAAVEPESADE